MMSQLVLIHGPGAGGCSAGYQYQLEHFPGSLAPDLPGHPDGESLSTVAEYTEWVRDWLHSRGHTKDLVLSGFTLGACIALQYALDHPNEVAGLLLMTIAMRPKERAKGGLEFRLNAAKDPQIYEDWLEAMRHSQMFIAPELSNSLIECHRKVGPRSQYNDLVTIDNFDVRDRIGELKVPLTLIRGMDDPGKPAEYELEIHEAVPGSKYIKLEQAGHFPMAERPDDINRALEELLA
ncbi:MAG: alpha/beta hydrolase [Chloroflexota bacterium]|nr:alpha/beta hydrolase [Chloroflexota bacterium]MQF67528.1 alpha/beta hydrolase [SAR202 cluster bacterium AD-802-F09_MRT_200m]